MDHSPETNQGSDDFVIWLSCEQFEYIDELLRRRLTIVTAYLRDFHATHPFGPSPYLAELSRLHEIEWVLEAAWFAPRDLWTSLAASKKEWELERYGGMDDFDARWKWDRDHHEEPPFSESDEQP